MELEVTAPKSESHVSEASSTEELVAWSLKRFADQRLVMTTSFGMEGCVLIDMYASHDLPLTCVYLDTMFFFPETYALRNRLIERYPNVHFINRGTTLTPAEQALRYGPELWKRDPDLCCRVRKVDPMRETLQEADVWVTALRRSQSVTRGSLRLIEWDWKYQVLKLCPLAAWDRPDVWEYIRRHDVPYNELHERGYPTIGCTHCTSPVDGASPADYSRSGRWKEFNKTECGLHGDGI